MGDMRFPAHGLIAESWAKSDIDLETAVPAASEVLLGGINSEGIVWERLSPGGNVYYMKTRYE